MAQYIHDLETGKVTELPDEPDDPSKREAFAWDLLRNHRDDLLAASDWTVLTDAPTDKTAWKAYRKALRDITDGLDDPNAVIWPEPPA